MIVYRYRDDPRAHWYDRTLIVYWRRAAAWCAVVGTAHLGRGQYCNCNSNSV